MADDDCGALCAQMLMVWQVLVHDFWVRLLLCSAVQYCIYSYAGHMCTLFRVGVQDDQLRKVCARCYYTWRVVRMSLCVLPAIKHTSVCTRVHGTGDARQPVLYAALLRGGRAVRHGVHRGTRARLRPAGLLARGARAAPPPHAQTPQRAAQRRHCAHSEAARRATRSGHRGNRYSYQ